MGRKKGYLLTVLTFMVVICGMIIQTPREVMASASGSCGKNVTWYFNSSNGTLTISGSGPMEAYSWDNIPWNDDKEKIAKVSVSEGVTTIGNNAFNECNNINSVTLPNSITSIGNSSFAGCSSMRSIAWPNSLITLGDYAFSECSSLESVTIPSKVKTVGYKAFNNCESVQVVYFNAASCSDFSSYDTFGNFGGKTNGAKVIFGNAVKRIPAKMFWTQKSYDAGNGKYAHITSVQMSNTIGEIGDYAFKGCYDLKSVSMSGSLKKIGNCVFADCISLMNIVIPAKVEAIGYDAFYNCNMVTNVTFNAISCSDFSWDGTFYNLGGNTNGVKVVFGNGVKRIPAKMFYTQKSYDAGNGNYAHITSVQMSNTIGEIGDYALKGCYDLKSVSMSSSLKKIGNCVFTDCISLMNIAIPAKVEAIGYDAFYNCTMVTNVIFNAISCSDFSSYDTFYNLGGNTKGVKVIFGNGVKRIPAKMFYTQKSYDAGNGNYAHITSVRIPDTVKTIGDYAFADCFDLKTITLPSKLSGIGWNTFSNCSQLKIYYEEKNIRYKIANYVLDGKGRVVVHSLKNKKVSSVSVPSTIKIAGVKFKVTAIAKEAFKNCNKLKKVTVGNEVTSLGENAFVKCSALEEVVIGKNLKKIGKNAFNGNKKLKKIVIKSKKLKYVESGSLKNIDSKAKIKVPSSKVKTYKTLLKEGGVAGSVKVSSL